MTCVLCENEVKFFFNSNEIKAGLLPISEFQTLFSKSHLFFYFSDTIQVETNGIHNLQFILF
jgi:hypothetical protein